MKKSILGLLLVASIGTIQLSSCKDKKEDTTNMETVDTMVTPAPAPVVIATDSQLETGVKDAVKDYPTVTATVNNGEVTLTGTITRDRLPNLMQSIQSLNPKKVNNNLTIQ
ncbi:MAG: BON domain-containing protein [Flavitalea sp.]